MSTKLSTNQMINKFNELFQLTPDERDELEASLLAFKFLYLIEEAMEQKGVSKTQLAQKIGTSKSFITQLFRGDKTPSWKMLVKMARAVELDFEICVKNDHIPAKNKDNSFEHLSVNPYTTNDIFAA